MAEDVVDNIKEAADNTGAMGIVGIGVICIIAAFIIVGVVGGIVFGVTSALAYLWNVSVAPLGSPTVVWWQVGGIWIIASCIRHFIKKVFQK